MASVTGITAEKAADIEDTEIVSGVINGSGHLILTKKGGETIDVGKVSDLDALTTHEGDTTTHGATGAVMGTTNSQTVSNKTLVLPVIADFTNAQHDHGGAVEGGALAIGVANDPAPLTSLTSVNMADLDSPKTIGSLTVPPGRWLIIGGCEGVTLAANTQTRFSWDLNSSQPTMNSKAVSASSQTQLIDGGRAVFGWLENVATATVIFRIIKNGNGALITTSTTGNLIAIRMG